MDETCHKAQDIDLALFLIEPHGSEWQEFRAHYPHCATCSAEVQKWTSLELGLRTLGNVGTSGHPSAEALVTFQQRSPHLAQESQHKIEAHLRSCAACREEVKLLGSFDFSRIQQWQQETQPITTADLHDSWHTRVWSILRSLFLHPAFAYGLVLLLSVPFIRSYYSASVNNTRISSDAVQTAAPAPTLGRAEVRQEFKEQTQQQASPPASSAPDSASVPIQLSAERAKEEFQAPQIASQAPASAPLVRKAPPEQAKEDTPPAKLAKQSARREDFAFKDKRTLPPPPVAPAPAVAAGVRARDAEIPAQPKSSMEEKGQPQAFANPPVATTAAEREARSTEGLISPKKRMEEEGAARPSSTRNAPPQAAALARGNIISPESRYRTALSSLLETYKNAYAARDLHALKNVWRMDQPWQEALTQLFAQSQRIELSLQLAEDQVTESADERQMSVPFSQILTAVNLEGQTVKHGPFFCVADIRQQNTGTWKIHELQDDPQHPGQCRFQL